MSLNLRYQQFQFNRKQQIAFLTQLMHLVNAGVPASAALNTMKKTFIARKSLHMARVANTLANNCRQGNPIGYQIDKWFNYTIAELLMTAEKRGMLAEGISQSIDYLTSSDQLFSGLKKGVPGIMYTIFSILVLTLIGSNILPKIGAYSQHWPLCATLLLKTANFISVAFPLIILSILAVMAWITKACRDYNGSWWQFVAIPFMPMYRAKIAYNLLNTLTLLTNSGLSVPEIIKIMLQHKQSGFIRNNLKVMDKRIQNGEQNMGQVLNTQLFTKAQIDELILISQYIEDDQLSSIYTVMRGILASQVNKMVKITAIIMNAVGMAVSGLGIVWLYGSIATLSMSIT